MTKNGGHESEMRRNRVAIRIFGVFRRSPPESIVGWMKVLGPLPMLLVAIAGIAIAHSDAHSRATSAVGPSTNSATSTQPTHATTPTTNTTSPTAAPPLLSEDGKVSPCSGEKRASQDLLPPSEDISTEFQARTYSREHGSIAVTAYVRREGTPYWLSKIQIDDQTFLEFVVSIRSYAIATLHNASVEIGLTNVAYNPHTLALWNAGYPKGLTGDNSVGDVPGIVGLGDLTLNQTAIVCFAGVYLQPMPYALGGMTATAAADGIAPTRPGAHVTVARRYRYSSP